MQCLERPSMSHIGNLLFDMLCEHCIPCFTSLRRCVCLVVQECVYMLSVNVLQLMCGDFAFCCVLFGHKMSVAGLGASKPWRPHMAWESWKRICCWKACLQKTLEIPPSSESPMNTFFLRRKRLQQAFGGFTHLEKKHRGAFLDWELLEPGSQTQILDPGLKIIGRGKWILFKNIWDCSGIYFGNGLRWPMRICNSP